MKPVCFIWPVSLTPANALPGSKWPACGWVTWADGPACDLKRSGSWARKTYGSTLMLGTAASVGTLARIAPRTKLASQSVRWAARTILWWTGQSVSVEGRDLPQPDGPAVLIANRAGKIDPLVLAATLPGPFLIADGSALAALPRQARFLLKPLVVPRVNGGVAMKGGTLQQRIERCLKAGYSVLVLPDGPTGVAPDISRFRLDAFRAAVEIGAAVQPVGVRGTSHIFDRGKQPGARDEAKILLGQPLHLTDGDQNGIAEERERVRKALAALSKSKVEG